MANQSKKQRAADRRAIVEQMQREQKARERRRALIGGAVVAVILLAIAGGVVYSVTRGHKTPPATMDVAAQVIPSTPTGPTTTQVKPSTVKNPTSISGVIAYNTGNYPGPGKTGPQALSHDHVPGPVVYAVTPPVGGPHNATWMNTGVYTQPVPAERAVHNLEHGAVWITYRPNLPATEVSQLVALYKKQSLISEPSDGGRSSRYVDLSPWTTNSLPAPIVISSWGYQLRVQSPTDPRLQQFIDTFRSSHTYTPEYGSPADGIPTRIGGKPALQ